METEPPESQHMGGVWERQVRSVKTILMSMLKGYVGRLNDESLRTLLVEVEAIVNFRPLTAGNLNDESMEPLTPNHLLTMKSRVVLPPPGSFQEADVYCRKSWRTVQYLSNVFWERWRKEYLLSLQERQKWRETRRNFQVGDVVLLKDLDLTRNKWPMARVKEVFPSEDGLVRKANVKVAGSGTTLLRPVTKLILLVKADV